MAVDPISLAASIGGKLITGLGQASAARKKNAILAEGQREQSRAGGEAAGVIGNFMDQLRASRATPEVERGAFNGVLQGPAVSGPMTASRQFRGDARAATTGAQAYGGQMADWLARLRAPGLQRQRESQMMAETGNALRPIQMRSANDDFMTQFRAGQVKENPLYAIAGQGLSNIGKAGMGG
jgi:hypothetical protein